MAQTPLQHKLSHFPNDLFVSSRFQYWLYPGNPFSLDVAFNANETRIEASRFLIQAINITDTNHEKQMVKDLRDICKDSPINITIFHPYFVFFDQFELVRPTSIQCMVIGAIIMMIISFIFIPNILCSIWITFSIISIEVGVVGYMSLWDVNLDSISMINLIMCIGFSIDFTAHICYVYMSSRCKKPKNRVREALYSLGLPIVQGSVSTILAVVPLLLAESYIFLVFFKMVFLVIFFGAMHGLFLLPVMLSLFGPNSCSSVDNVDSEDGIVFQYNENTTHPRRLTHASSPNGVYTSRQFPAEFEGLEEKDLGIGTSSEDSSENSSSKSQRRKAMDDESVKRRYEMGWRKSSQSITASSPCTFSPALDLYGNRFEDFWNSTDNITNTRRDSHERSRNDRQVFSERNSRGPLGVEYPGNDRKTIPDTIVLSNKSRDSHEWSRSDLKKFSEMSNEERLAWNICLVPNALSIKDYDRANDNIHYYDYNQKRKTSNESTDKEAPRKSVKTRRNIV